MISSGATATIGMGCEATSSGYRPRLAAEEKPRRTATSQAAANDSAKPSSVSWSVGSVWSHRSWRFSQPRYSRRGHIPGSRSLPGRGPLDGTGRILPEPELAARIGAVLDSDDSPVVLYCGGGISAAGAALALTLLGRTDISVYDGSPEEWSEDPARPPESGG
ncbi:rhodanese-like domain-containing protein [Streptomyces sp. NPDC050549]|uniref:rhodanese-like domain-containing protein n=1 Tax=Streptomyces sp. NPDC050549 TaxID=3155406 RepID=UPI003442D655